LDKLGIAVGVDQPGTVSVGHLVDTRRPSAAARSRATSSSRDFPHAGGRFDDNRAAIPLSRGAQNVPDTSDLILALEQGDRGIVDRTTSIQGTARVSRNSRRRLPSPATAGITTFCRRRPPRRRATIGDPGRNLWGSMSWEAPDARIGHRAGDDGKTNRPDKEDEMPLIEVRALEGVFTAQQRKQLG
jgi:hypothetical protein